MYENMDALTHGCYIVTTVLDEKRYGMTCSWGTQIDDKKILLVLFKQSTTASAIRKSKIFGVSVLAEGQQDIALHFGKNHSRNTDKFKDIDYGTGEMGLPLINGSVKTLECELDEESKETKYIGNIKHFHKNRERLAELLMSQID